MTMTPAERQRAFRALMAKAGTMEPSAVLEQFRKITADPSMATLDAERAELDREVEAATAEAVGLAEQLGEAMARKALEADDDLRR